MYVSVQRFLHEQNCNKKKSLAPILCESFNINKTVVKTGRKRAIALCLGRIIVREAIQIFYQHETKF